jgi:hypothetical protein
VQGEFDSIFSRDIIAHRIQLPASEKSEETMYIYYILRRIDAEETLEYEGDIDAEDFPGVDLDNGPAIINHLVQKLHRETGEIDNWEECDLTDSFFNREDNYVKFNGRWMRRSDTPWRKDRNN